MRPVTHVGREAVRATRPLDTTWPLAGVLVLVAVTVLLGVARWTGEAPVGSDNDEYRLVARQLVGLDAPVVAGVEGTKYPLGYPAALAVVDAVGLAVVPTALVLNVVLVGVAAGLTAVAARRRGPLGVVVAGAVVLLSRPLWAATQSTMPDVALTAVVAGALAVADGPRLGERARALALAGLATVATALKSVGLLLGLAASAALVVGRRVPRWLAAVPAGAALALTVLTAAVVGRYPEHTTGYARTFWLDDPYDAAGGDASVLEVAGRLFTRADVVADDASRAVWGDLVHGWPAWLLTAVLLAAAVAGARRRAFVAAFVVLDVVFLALWPYASVRFGLPLVPVAALGAATIATAVAERARVSAVPAVAVASLAALAVVADALPTFEREADREAALYAELDGARLAVADWVETAAPDAVLVSPDYRELATVLDRAVLPLSYTSDADDLLDEASRGTYLVRFVGLYGSRDEVVAALLAAHGDRFEPAFTGDRVEVLRLVGP